MTSAKRSEKVSRPWWKNLTVQVLLAMVLGAIIGGMFPETGVAMKPLADGFIKLIKMVVGPIIFLTIVTGFSHMGDIKKVGKIGGISIIYFEVVTTIALILGMVSMNVFKPGKGMDIQASANHADVSAYVNKAAEPHSTADFLLDIIPHTFSSAFVEGNLLQILFVACMAGVVISGMGEHGRKIEEACERLTTVFFGIIQIIMYVAPLGAFGALAFTVGKYGVSSLIPLGELVLVTAGTLIFFVVAVLGAISWYYGFSVLRFVRYIKEELIIVLGTSSSETVLPRMMEKLQRLGCSKPVVGLVLPTGYSFNLDGSSIYLSMGVIFIAQAFNIDLTLGQQLSLLGILLLTSKGAAGVVGSAFIVLAATIQASGILPLEGLALLLGIDRFMSTARALTNLIGNGVATVVVAKMQKEFDEKKALAEYREHFKNPRLNKI